MESELAKVGTLETIGTSNLEEPVGKWKSLNDAEMGLERPTRKKGSFERGPVIRDVIIGFADGLTVPFALTAGLSSLGSSKLVILAGLAELISGAISMGLGAYLAACTEDEHYKSEEKRQRRAVCVEPKQEAEALYEMMATYGVTRDATTPLVESLCCNTDMWVQFAMDLVLKLDKQSRLRAYVSGATMGFAYFAGGIIPMIPYFAIARVTNAFFVSIGLTALVLLAFGYIKTRVVIASHRTAFFGALQTLTIGGIAAGASYGIVRALGGHNSCS